IDMTSCRGDTIKAVAAKAAEKGKNIRFVDAPVSGGVAGAEAGTLTIMAGCEQADFELVKPVLEAMGKKIFYTGGLGSGKDIKMLNQLLNAGNTIVASEVLFLAKKLGIDLDLFMNVINESTGASWVFKNNVPKFMIPESYEGGFRLDLMKKDVGLAVEQINSDKLCMPVTSMIYQIFQAMSNNGYDTQNYNAVSEWIKKLNRPL
ncbi:MAG TPA: NAD(P)-dependent oxidoreductase, partial [Ruminococcaceae bacterium]|nr:NAD(P)-dependent oxidoreductase [Oscillospiraceae bacterium]